MTHPEIMSRLRSIFRELFNDDSLNITEATTADDIDGWDSIAHVNLIVAIEQEFGIAVPLGELEGLKNVGHMAALIDDKIGGARA